MSTYSIGIDIGGTNTDIGLVRDDGRCLAKKNLPTNKYFDASIYVSDIYDQIKALMADNNVTIIDGIGIAAPARKAQVVTRKYEHAPTLIVYNQLVPSWRITFIFVTISKKMALIIVRYHPRPTVNEIVAIAVSAVR